MKYFKTLLFISLLILINSQNVTKEEVMEYISTIVNKKCNIKDIKVWALENYYEHQLKPSVAKYLFEDIDMVEHIAPEGNSNRPGDKHEKVYICVHDTGDFSFGAKQWSDAVYNAKIGDHDYDVSYQYVVGNDGYYHNIPDDETAYHAGDGAQRGSWFEEYPTNVYGVNEKPYVMISTDGYYMLDGQKTNISAPRNNEDEILTRDYIDDLGIYTTIKDGQYYIGSTWYSETYDRIANHGGNTHSIGIESCVNKGSDIYLTMQRLAKLVAKLLDDNNFGFDRIVQHHYFSGKDCPQTMRTEGYWEHFLDLVKTEYQMLMYKKMGFKFEFETYNDKYVDKLGRVINRGTNLNINAKYRIRVIDPDGEAIDRDFVTIIPSEKVIG
jgi:N-acetylmuramoyl-L-alanine amidase CwlA